MAEKGVAMRELLTKYCVYGSAVCIGITRKSAEAMVGSSYGKGVRRARRISGKSARQWEMEKRASLSNNFGSYNCGGYGS